MCSPVVKVTVCQSPRARPTNSLRTTRGKSQGQVTSSTLRCGGNVCSLFCLPRPSFTATRLRKRNSKIERCSFIQNAIKIDAATVLLNNQFGNRQTQTIAANFGLRTVMRLVEALEDVWAVLSRDAGAGIRYDDPGKMPIVGKGTNR